MKETYAKENTLSATRNYKDTVFRKLFHEKSELLNLYNAINGTCYDDPDDLWIVTLDNAIYMSMKNDLAFVIDAQLHLYEHQSTINPNMPLRFLQYVAKEYETLIEGHLLYRSQTQKIPAPHFVVFYNGSSSQPETQLLKLSNAFESPEQDPQLELKVLVLNINPGYNTKLLEQCPTLKEYMQYTERVRRYAAESDIHTAVTHAVNECIQDGILREFLKRNKAEVVAMSIFEYDEEAVFATIRDEERQLGKEEGKLEGKSEGKSESILLLLEEFGCLPDHIKAKTCSERNPDTLNIWLRLAAKSESLEQFIQAM